MDQSLFERYLRILGVSREEPCRAALFRLTHEHLTRIPFENISKLYYRNRFSQRSIIPLDMYLDGIEKYNFGGTCYSNNYHMYNLLNHLGYRVKLCSADIAVESAPPDAHMVSIVALDGEEFIVDVGYAAPLWQPLPRFLNEDFVIELGYEKYILKPWDGNGAQSLELYRHGELKHGYRLKSEPRDINFFTDVIARSYSEQAAFMNAVALVRFFDDSALIIRNLTLTEFSGNTFKTEAIESRDRLIAVIENRFGIPASITVDALAQMSQFRSLWG